MDNQDEGILTLDEAVQFLGTSRPTLYRLLSQGDLKGLKVGRQWRFRKADLTAYMERSPVALAAAPADVLHEELAFFQAGGAGEDGQETAQLAQAIIRLALAQRASDIHLEPAHLDGEAVSLLRLRVDGVLHEIRRLAVSVHEGLIAQFKIMAEMNVAERRAPQDGRIPLRHEGNDFDLHAGTVPALYGEALIVRILVRNNILVGLDRIDLSGEEQAQLRAWMQRPAGLLLFTAPLGNGKTTTVYSCLRERVGAAVKTLTLEDPVELSLPYATQTQIAPAFGLTYAAGLRALLRQDPDIVYVSEVPDLAASRLAVQIALMGHLVLTTLPAPDAPAALTHLLDMGLAPHLVASTTLGVVAQRLVRRLCPHCKEAYQVPARDLLRFGLEPDDPAGTVTLYRGRGCDHCRQRGYLGRVCLFEILEMTEQIADLVVARAPREEISAAAQAVGMNTLTQAGLLKALDGVTTPDEVMRVTASAV